jgi:hypothetical protein
VRYGQRRFTKIKRGVANYSTVIELGEIMIRNCVLGLCALGALLTASSAQAELFISDQFNYANGDLTTVDGTGANVSGGAWVGFSGTGFPAESLTVVNGQVEALISGSEDAARSIPNPLTDFMTAGETWYYGARVTVNDQRATPASTAIINEYFMMMKDTGTTNFRSRLYVNNPSTGTGGAGYRFGIGPSSGAANAVNWGSDLAFGTTYTVVASYEHDTGFVKLWVDPVDASSTSVTATASPGAATFITDLAIRQAFNNGGVAGGPGVLNTQILIDGVSMADNFAQALAAVAIPEPSSALLGLASFVGLTVARRRR